MYIVECVMRVAKWGNSLAIRLPDVVVKALQLKTGDDVEVIMSGGKQFEIRKDRSREKALKKLQALKKPLPKGFRFDREAARER
jgi:antitoxin MazE